MRELAFVGLLSIARVASAQQPNGCDGVRQRVVAETNASCAHRRRALVGRRRLEPSAPWSALGVEALREHVHVGEVTGFGTAEQRDELAAGEFLGVERRTDDRHDRRSAGS